MILLVKNNADRPRLTAHMRLMRGSTPPPEHAGSTTAEAPRRSPRITHYRGFWHNFHSSLSMFSLLEPFSVVACHWP
jgi:hypothetical protein